MAADDELLSINQELEDEEEEEDDELLSINEVLEMMKPTVLNYKEPVDFYSRFWVFWNGEDSTLSSDIISALSSFWEGGNYETFLVQFWAPVTIYGQRMLTTVNQPFAFLYLERELCEYRAHSLNCKFNLDSNYNNGDGQDVDEEAQLLPNSNYARVFLSGLPEIFSCVSSNFYSKNYSMVLPVFEPPSTSPVGVLEVTYPTVYDSQWITDCVDCKRVLKVVNLTTFDSWDYLECQNIQGLQPAKDEINKVLKIICDRHNLPLAQAWIGFPYMDDNNVPCTSNNVSNISYLKSIKEEFALKVVDCFRTSVPYDIAWFKRFSDVFPLRKDLGLVGKSLLTHKPYFCKNIKNLNATDDPLMGNVSDNHDCFTICIRSTHTGSLDYVLWFVWDTRDDDKFLLDSIIAAMKRHLPTFKVSSGEELGDDLFVQCIKGSMNDELDSSEICITTKATSIPEFFEREGEAVQLDPPIQQLIAEDTTHNCELVQPGSLHNQSDGNTRVLVSEGEVAQPNFSCQRYIVDDATQNACNLVGVERSDTTTSMQEAAESLGEEEDEPSIDEVLEMMKPTVLSYKEPVYMTSLLWVFWNGEDSTLSSDVIRHNIRSALSSFSKIFWCNIGLVQFWAPMTIEGQRLLTTVNQPFALSSLSRGLCKYRAHSLNCKFNLEPNSNYARVFLSGLPEFFQQRRCNSSIKGFSMVLPVFEPFISRSLVGVLEVTYPDYDINDPPETMDDDLDECKRVLKVVNLTTFDSSDYLQCQNITGLQSAKDEIQKGLKLICDLDKLPLAQAWIGFPYMDDNNVTGTSNNVFNISCLKSIKEEFVLKVVEYFNEDYRRIDSMKLCDVFPLRKGQGLVGKSLLTHKAYYCKIRKNLKRTEDPLMLTLLFNYSYFTICIRSIHTESHDYVLQFIWRKRDDDMFVLTSIVAAMKLHLPNFKVSSGEKLGENLPVQCIERSVNYELHYSEIFITTKPTPIPESFEREGQAVQLDLSIQQLIAEDTTQNGELVQPDSLHNQSDGSTCVLVSEGEVAQVDVSVEQRSTTTSLQQSGINDRFTKRYSTDPIPLSREDIEQHYGKTQKEAAESLGVSVSTLKRKCRDYGITSWQGPSKKGVSDSRINLKHTNGVIKGGKELIQEVNGVNPSRSDPNIGLTNQPHMHDAKTINILQEASRLTVKASYKDDIIKFHLSSLSTIANVEEEISKSFKLNVGTFRLKYKDEDNDLVSIISDEHLQVCMASSRSLNRTTIQMSVHLI